MICSLWFLYYLYGNHCWMNPIESLIPSAFWQFLGPHLLAKDCRSQVNLRCNICNICKHQFQLTVATLKHHEFWTAITNTINHNIPQSTTVKLAWKSPNFRINEMGQAMLHMLCSVYSAEFAVSWHLNTGIIWYHGLWMMCDVTDPRPHLHGESHSA